MAVNKDMFHAQTTPSNQLFNAACEVFDGVSKLKERIAELEKENESLKYNVATLETGDGFWRVIFNNKEKVDYLVNEGKIKRWIPFPKTIG